MAEQDDSEKMVPLSQARANMSALLNRARHHKERFIITQHGQPAATVVPIEDLRVLEAFSKATEDAVSHREDGNNRDSLAVATRFQQNRVPILLVSDLVLGLIEEVRERIRGDNELSPEDREAALEALGGLQVLICEANELSRASPEAMQGSECVQTWPRRFKAAFEDSLHRTFDAANLANATVPTGVILGCGALGALIGGPVGFGAGSLFGHLITGQIKPSAAAMKVEEAISTDDEFDPATE